jgi:hypothetical protein
VTVPLSPSAEPSALAEAPPARARWFGIAPQTTLLVVTLLVLAAAVVLFAVGLWPAGLIVGGVGLLLLTAFIETARRRPAGAHAGRAAALLSAAKAQGTAGAESLAARSQAGRKAARIRLELRRLRAHRRVLLAALGDAVYRNADADEPRRRLEALDAHVRSLEQQLADAAAQAQARIQKAQLAVQSTEPITVPEPYPPPDEGDPPAPTVEPEPLPPPDEGTPPQPDPVPTPGPEPPAGPDRPPG